MSDVRLRVGGGTSQAVCKAVTQPTAASKTTNRAVGWARISRKNFAVADEVESCAWRYQGADSSALREAGRAGVQSRRREARMFRRVWGPAAQGCCHPRVGDIGGCDQPRNIYLDSSGAIPIDRRNTRRKLSSELVVATTSCPTPRAEARQAGREASQGRGLGVSQGGNRLDAPGRSYQSLGFGVEEHYTRRGPRVAGHGWSPVRLIDLTGSCRHRAELGWAEVVATASARADRSWHGQEGSQQWYWCAVGC